MLADLFAVGVAAGGDVVEFLEHRQVLVGLDVAHDTGVAIPVPRASDAAGVVDDPDAFDAGFAEVGAGEQAGDAATDDDHIGVVGNNFTFGVRGERVDPVPGKVLVAGQIENGGAARNEAFIALSEVFSVHSFGVEGHGPPFRGHLGQCYKIADKCHALRPLPDGAVGLLAEMGDRDALAVGPVALKAADRTAEALPSGCIVGSDGLGAASAFSRHRDAQPRGFAVRSLRDQRGSMPSRAMPLAPDRRASRPRTRHPPRRSVDTSPTKCNDTGPHPPTVSPCGPSLCEECRGHRTLTRILLVSADQ